MFYRNSSIIFILILCTVYHVSSDSCADGKRVILRSSSGNFTSGEHEYPTNEHCEWLIVASKDQYIQVNFTVFATECSFDYVIIYDGDSRSSPKLGAFSGSLVPTTITARSGKMLIYLFSDTNFVLAGFRAVYEIHDCPNNCSGVGICDKKTHKCKCSVEFAEDDCSAVKCAENCWEFRGHGRCTMNGCQCQPNYFGDSCNLPILNREGMNGWFILSHNHTFRPRTAHASVYMSSSDKLYVYGGYDLTQLLGDMVVYDFNINRWSIYIPPNGIQPAPRMMHTMVKVNSSYMLVFGGQIKINKPVNELWLFNHEKGWLKIHSPRTLMPLAGHTANFINNKMYIIGGRTRDDSYSDAIYIYDLLENTNEEDYQPIGLKATNIRLIGHTTVYHKNTDTILIYGGYYPDSSKFSKITDRILSYNLITHYLAEYETFSSNKTHGNPGKRTYHSAVIMGDYMVVYGGTRRVNESTSCYDSTIYFLHLGCRTWHTRDSLGLDYKVCDHNSFDCAASFHDVSISLEPSHGRFSHTVDVKNNSILLIIGGFNGKVLNELLAYKAPNIIAESSVSLMSHACAVHSHRHPCLEDPACLWCPNNFIGKGVCLSSNKPSSLEECMSPLEYPLCPGECSSMTTCKSCAVFGNQTAKHRASSSPTCFWCVHKNKCQANTEHNRNNCSGGYIDLPNEETKVEQTILTEKDCLLHNYPNGLTYSYYINKNDVPDKVESPHSPHVVIDKPMPGFSTPISYTIRLEGYFYANALFKERDMQNVQIGARNHQLSGTLYIQLDPHSNDLHNLELPIPPSVPKKFSDYLSATYHTRLYILYEGTTREISLGKRYDIGTVSLMYRKRNNAGTLITYELDMKYLRPFRNFPSMKGGAECQTHTNCLSCLLDESCGWVYTNSECSKRTDIEVLYLKYTVDSAQCQVCSQFYDCKKCTESKSCVWLKNEVRCVGKHTFGSQTNVIDDHEQCTKKCNERVSCAECATDECAWCSETRQCFPFSAYLVKFAYGSCNNWIDKYSKDQCLNCSEMQECDECINKFGCGFCSNKDDPSIGSCVSGDFSNPVHGTCAQILKSSLAPNHTILFRSQFRNESFSAIYSYEYCPDIDECKQNEGATSLCGKHAYCINTDTAYNCICEDGYKYNQNSECVEDCNPPCVAKQGSCVDLNAKKVCECHLGYYGKDCSKDCGCNFHSNCNENGTICLQCKDLTRGEKCDMCVNGTYGNPKDSTGCNHCNCNGHGDMSRGMCNNKTGDCYCLDDTAGINCERCKDGFYGEPTRGKPCYRNCDGWSIVTNAKGVGHIGSSNLQMNGKRVSCIWQITDRADPKGATFNPMTRIKLQITDIQIECGFQYVVVYDGTPSFMGGLGENSATSNGDSESNNKQSTLLGQFCGSQALKDMVVEASSGVLTVFFEGNITGSKKQYFEASYTVIQCPCPGNRICISSRCQCANGWTGTDCEIAVCPNNCSKQGKCDEDLRMCICNASRDGDDCSIESDKDKGFIIIRRLLLNTKSTQSSSPNNVRMGHQIVFLGEKDPTIFVVGGVADNRKLASDAFRWSLRDHTSSPMTMQTLRGPVIRTYFAIAYLDDLTFINGGIGHDSALVDDLWMHDFNEIDGKTEMNELDWTQLEVASWVPPLAMHTMTATDKRTLIIIGGYSPENGFNNYTIEYDVGKAQWRHLDFNGSAPVGVYGHSAVFYEATRAIYVFGGYRFHLNAVSLSNKLYSFNIETNFWSLLLPVVTTQVYPRPTAFHQALIVNNYMVVLGGRTAKDDFSDAIMFYRFGTNSWLDGSNFDDRISKGVFRPTIGHAAIKDPASGANHDYVYVYGGFNGVMQSTLYKFRFPHNLCSLIKDEKQCRNTRGCTLCLGQCNDVAFMETTASCPFSRDDDEMSCASYRTCTECLAVFPTAQAKRGQLSHTFYKPPKCKWCPQCQDGACVPINELCEANGRSCSEVSHSYTDLNSCIELRCKATDCGKCIGSGRCIWTRHFKHAGGIHRFLSPLPEYPWACFLSSLVELVQFKFSRSPPDQCPLPCHSYKNCTSCLESPGSDGGWKKCYWSTVLSICMSPTYVAMRCSVGECGLVVKSSAKGCPMPCESYTKCSSCTEMPHCGWCSLRSSNGLGACWAGGLNGPLDSRCTSDSVISHIVKNKAIYNVKDQDFDGLSGHSWSYNSCPEEDECTNGHHTCNMTTQNCTNTQKSFFCECKDGYLNDTHNPGHCIPKCEPTCKHGTCISPGECHCDKHYTNQYCDQLCNCNGHSNCMAAGSTQYCIECTDNTLGKYCQNCQLGFYGLPKNSKTNIESGKINVCRDCLSICNGKSSMCGTRAQINMLNITPFSTLEEIKKEYRGKLKEGANTTRSQDIHCLGCRENTKGQHCQECQIGYFKEKPTSPCTKCKCNGHGLNNACNRTSGLHCQCLHHTTTKITDKNELQCAACQESYTGWPIDNRQCYKELVGTVLIHTVDTENSPLIGTKPISNLEPGRTSFFAITPPYNNANVRVSINIVEGEVDVYVSKDNQTFKVSISQDSTKGDKVYVTDDQKKEIPLVKPTPKRFKSPNSNQASSSRTKRFAPDPKTQSVRNSSNPHSTEPVNRVSFYTIKPTTRVFFFTVPTANFLLYFEKINGRLVIIFPVAVHSVSNEQYFVVIHNNGTVPVKGIIYHDQRMSELNLFVFVTVFVSLVLCALFFIYMIYKLRQFILGRRNHRRSERERDRMKERPSVALYVFYNCSTNNSNVNQIEPSTFSSKKHLKSQQKNSPQITRSRQRFNVAPHAIAVEPLSDSSVAVVTVLIELPGGKASSNKAMLGSSLVHYKPNMKSSNTGTKRKTTSLPPTHQSYTATFRHYPTATQRGHMFPMHQSGHITLSGHTQYRGEDV